MKTLVLFYSKTGSNRYLAERIAAELKADIEEIESKFNALLFVIFSSLLRFGLGIKKPHSSFNQYERIVVVGPIYMGTLKFPLRQVFGMIPTSVNRFALQLAAEEEMMKKTISSVILQYSKN